MHCYHPDSIKLYVSQANAIYNYFVACIQFTETKHTVPDAVSFSCRVVSSCVSRVDAEHS